MAELKTARIETVEGGYIVDLDFAWRDRPESEVQPAGRRLVVTTLTEALILMESHLLD
jgi:hypothetical protein